METAQLYVGADNETGLLDLSRIETIVGKRHDGFTVWPAKGFWQGSAEDSAVVMVSDDHDSIMATIADLKSELRQDAIGYQIAPALQFA